MWRNDAQGHPTDSPVSLLTDKRLQCKSAKATSALCDAILYLVPVHPDPCGRPPWGSGAKKNADAESVTDLKSPSRDVDNGS